MLDWMRGRRFDLKTTIIVIAIALAAWALFVYVAYRDYQADVLVEQPTN